MLGRARGNAIGAAACGQGATDRGQPLRKALHDLQRTLVDVCQLRGADTWAQRRDGRFCGV
eukprot:scaffold2207_cov70-Phaeocystis_antarctica.AAC.1